MFSLQRCWICLRNDLLSLGKLALLAMLAVLASFIAFMPYRIHLHQSIASLPALAAATLTLGGLLLPFYLWSDLHHATGRNHYLMLPYSNLERFVARWLLCAPLYLLVPLVFYGILQVLTAIEALIFGEEVRQGPEGNDFYKAALSIFVVLQPFAFAGAIRFRRFAFLLTTMAVMALLVALLVVGALSGYFVWRDWLAMAGSTFSQRGELIQPLWMYWEYRIFLLTPVFLLWMLYLAWLMLIEQEVHDEV